jgi:hypothetical protein
MNIYEHVLKFKWNLSYNNYEKFSTYEIYRRDYLTLTTLHSTVLRTV